MPERCYCGFLDCALCYPPQASWDDGGGDWDYELGRDEEDE